MRYCDLHKALNAKITDDAVTEAEHVRGHLGGLRRHMKPTRHPLDDALNDDLVLDGLPLDADPVARRLYADFDGVLVGGALRDLIRYGSGHRPRDLDFHVTDEATLGPSWEAFVAEHPPTRKSGRRPGGVSAVLTWESAGAIPVQAIVLQAGHDTAGQIAGFFDSTANALAWSLAGGLVSYGPGMDDILAGYYRPHWPGIFASCGPVAYMGRLITRLLEGGWRVDPADRDAMVALASRHLSGPSVWSAPHPSGDAGEAKPQAPECVDDIPF